jgi:hypothetical protein
MIVGGFETLEAYLQWMRTPLDPEILEKLEQDTLDAYLEDKLLEEIRREAEGEEPDEGMDEEDELENGEQKPLPNNQVRPQFRRHSEKLALSTK